MKTISIVALSLSALTLSTSALAHVRIGTYAGTDAVTGAECTVEMRAVRFENNLRHPINERIDVIENGTRAWTLHHPVSVSVMDPAVEFSGATLEASTGISGGADAFVIEMSHEEGHEGPKAFHSIHHDYRDGSKTTHATCANLTFRESHSISNLIKP